MPYSEIYPCSVVYRWSNYSVEAYVRFIRVKATMSIEKKIEKNCLVLVQLETHKSYEFPIIWLRDNCQCQECFDKVTYSRKIDWETFNLNVETLRDAKVRLIDELMWFMTSSLLSLSRTALTPSSMKPKCGWKSIGATNTHLLLTTYG